MVFLFGSHPRLDAAMAVSGVKTGRISNQIGLIPSSGGHGLLWKMIDPVLRCAGGAGRRRRGNGVARAP